MRLTNTIRNEINAAMCAAAFDAEQEALSTKLDSALRDLYHQVVCSVELIEEAERLEKKARGVLATKQLAPYFLDQVEEYSWTEAVRFNIGGVTVMFYAGARVLEKPGSYRVDVEATNELGATVVRLMHQQKEISESRKLFAAKVNGVLKSVTTSDKLVKLWPEAGEFIPDNVLPTAGKELAPVISELTKHLSSAPKQ